MSNANATPGAPIGNTVAEGDEYINPNSSVRRSRPDTSRKESGIQFYSRALRDVPFDR